MKFNNQKKENSYSQQISRVKIIIITSHIKSEKSNTFSMVQMIKTP